MKRSRYVLPGWFLENKSKVEFVSSYSDEKKECPYCGREMKKGYWASPSIVIASEKQSLLAKLRTPNRSQSILAKHRAGKNDILLTDDFGTVPIHVCTTCKKVIADGSRYAFYQEWEQYMPFE